MEFTNPLEIMFCLELEYDQMTAIAQSQKYHDEFQMTLNIKFIIDLVHPKIMWSSTLIRLSCTLLSLSMTFLAFYESRVKVHLLVPQFTILQYKIIFILFSTCASIFLTTIALSFPHFALLQCAHYIPTTLGPLFLYTLLCLELELE